MRTFVLLSIPHIRILLPFFHSVAHVLGYRLVGEDGLGARNLSMTPSGTRCACQKQVDRSADGEFASRFVVSGSTLSPSHLQ